MDPTSKLARESSRHRRNSGAFLPQFDIITTNLGASTSIIVAFIKTIDFFRLSLPFLSPPHHHRCHHVNLIVIFVIIIVTTIYSALNSEQCSVFDVGDIYLEWYIYILHCRPAVISNPVCFHFTPAIKFGKGQVIQAKQPLTQNDPGWI